MSKGYNGLYAWYEWHGKEMEDFVTWGSNFGLGILA